MENISFKQFIYTFNFKNYDESKKEEHNKEDTLIIRVHCPLKEMDKIFDNNCWFEFGIYDFSNKNTTWSYCCRFLSQEILNSYVSCIRFNKEENNVVNIWIIKKKDFID